MQSGGRHGAPTRDRILDAARAILRDGGPGALTFDAVAARVGVTKQAVIYWFPRKPELLRALALPSIRAEADVAIAALSAPEGSAPERFVRAVVGFHLADLDRFRLVYVVPQSGPAQGPAAFAEVVEAIHPVTAGLYQALANALGDPDPTRARRRAVAIHMAALGLVLMVALTEHLGDPLAHPHDALTDALAGLVGGA